MFTILQTSIDLVARCFPACTKPIFSFSYLRYEESPVNKKKDYVTDKRRRIGKYLQDFVTTLVGVRMY
jgi:hypothetical protein